MNAIIMTEEYWVSSPFSIARYYGQIRIEGKVYVIVNKEGITLRELSNPMGKHYVGDDNIAIPPGEPVDLILMDWIPVYRALGREKTIELVKEGVSLVEALQLIPKSMKPKTRKEEKKSIKK